MVWFFFKYVSDFQVGFIQSVIVSTDLIVSRRSGHSHHKQANTLYSNIMLIRDHEIIDAIAFPKSFTNHACLAENTIPTSLNIHFSDAITTFFVPLGLAMPNKSKFTANIPQVEQTIQGLGSLVAEEPERDIPEGPGVAMNSMLFSLLSWDMDLEERNSLLHR